MVLLENSPFLWCLVYKSSTIDHNFLKLGHIVKYHNVFFKFIVPCLQELLLFVHPNMSFWAL